MKIILTKTTKLALKGSKDKKFVPANGEVIEVTDANGKALIENGLATDPSQEVVAASENVEAIQTLEDEIQTLKDAAIVSNEDIEKKDAEIVSLKDEIQTLKDAADLLGGGAE